MKVVLFTDNLGSGGAQRQLCLLACEMQRIGHAVTVVTYNSESREEGDFFLPLLESRNIPHKVLRTDVRILRPWALRMYLKTHMPDAVLAFQSAPSLYAEVAGMFGRKWGLVVSERAADPKSTRGISAAIRNVHRFADCITANSMSGRSVIHSSRGCRRLRVQVVYNGVDLEYFRPAEMNGDKDQAVGGRPTRFVVLASHQRNKNLQNILSAVVCVRGRANVNVKWYGGLREDTTSFDEGMEFIRKNGLNDCVELLPPTNDARQAYWDCDAVILGSLHEGCPNVICEAMACAKPVLASAVCDNPAIVIDGLSGFLFDPLSPTAIADAILRFAALPAEGRRDMGAEGRKQAEALFSVSACARRYAALLEDAVCIRRRAMCKSLS